MKKIILLIVIAIIALLPLIGNKVIESAIDEKVKAVSANGVKVQNSSTDSGYFSTSKHYEFVIGDSDKLISYLNQYSDKQIPAYISLMLKGMHIGLDMSYSNMLFNDSVELDIYPLSLADKAAMDLEKEDKDLYKYITNFLKIKGLLYHLNYNLSSEDFNGYIKDIDEEYTSKDGTKTKLLMKNIIYSGNGSLMHPSQMDSTLQKIVIQSVNKKEAFDLVVENVTSSSNFKTKTTYFSKANIEKVEFKTHNKESAEVYLNDLKFALDADTQSSKAKFSSKSSFKELSFKTSKENISLYDFNYDVNLKEINKEGFEELSGLLEKARTEVTPELQMKISNTMFAILLNGLVLDVKDISLGKVSKGSLKSVDAFSINALATLKAGSKQELVKNISLDAFVKISKDFFKMMNKELPASMIAGGFAKELGKDYVFDIKFKDSKLTVNGKDIK